MDVSMYRALNPRMNRSMDDAAKLAARLQAYMLMVTETVCVAQGDGKGWGLTGEQTLQELIDAGVARDYAVHLHFRFFGLPDLHPVALVDEMFGEGGVVGFQRIHDAIYPGSPIAYLHALFRIPAVFELVDKFLKKGVPKEIQGAPPPPIRFPHVQPGVEESADGEALAEAAETAEVETAEELAQPADRKESARPKPRKQSGSAAKGKGKGKSK